MGNRKKEPGDHRLLDPELRRQLDMIRSADTPERLLQLARALQALLRGLQKPT